MNSHSDGNSVRIRSLAGVLTLVATLAIPAMAGPLEDGADAYRTQDYAKAAQLWQPPAEQGNAEAQYRLGTLYAEGKGVERNDATAFMWMQRAATQGNASAQYDVGASYIEGAGVKKDESEAAKWFKRAANQGMVYAQFNLGLLYASGSGVPQDNVEALKWLDLALFALPAGSARSDASRAIVDVAAKMDDAQKREAATRERAWKAVAETK